MKEQEEKILPEAKVIELHPTPPEVDFMTVRRRLSKCNNPLEVEVELRKIKEETGVSLSALKKCAREIEREKRDRQQEIRRQKNGGGVIPQKNTGDQPEWANALLRNKDGEIKDCPFNVSTILENHPEWIGRIRTNRLGNFVEIDGKAITDADIFGVLRWCGRTLRFAIRHENTVYSALKKIGADNSYNPVVDMYEALPHWDGTPRMDHLFSDFLGARQDEYSAYVGRMLLCSMVARAYEPGCIMRRMPVLEGPENAGKSRFVHDLGHPWGAEISSNMESAAKFEEDIRGIFVAELMEMDALRKAASSRIKAAISLRSFRGRDPYGRVSESHPRTTVFVGTINPNKALSLFEWDDENTRFFPIVIKSYNSDAFLSAKQQLFAEAKAFVAAHQDNWWEESEQVKVRASALRAGRSAIDPWFDPIAEFLLTGQTEVSIPEILFDCLKIPTERHGQHEATRVGKILHSLQWAVSRTTRTGARSKTRIYQKLTPNAVE